MRDGHNLISKDLTNPEKALVRRCAMIYVVSVSPALLQLQQWLDVEASHGRRANAILSILSRESRDRYHLYAITNVRGNKSCGKGGAAITAEWVTGVLTAIEEEALPNQLTGTAADVIENFTAVTPIVPLGGVAAQGNGNGEGQAPVNRPNPDGLGAQGDALTRAIEGFTAVLRGMNRPGHGEREPREFREDEPADVPFPRHHVKPNDIGFFDPKGIPDTVAAYSFLNKAEACMDNYGEQKVLAVILNCLDNDHNEYAQSWIASLSTDEITDITFSRVGLRLAMEKYWFESKSVIRIKAEKEVFKWKQNRLPTLYFQEKVRLYRMAGVNDENDLVTLVHDGIKESGLRLAMEASDCYDADGENSLAEYSRKLRSVMVSCCHEYERSKKREEKASRKFGFAKSKDKAFQKNYSVARTAGSKKPATSDGWVENGIKRRPCRHCGGPHWDDTCPKVKDGNQAKKVPDKWAREETRSGKERTKGFFASGSRHQETSSRGYCQDDDRQLSEERQGGFFGKETVEEDECVGSDSSFTSDSQSSSDSEYFSSSLAKASLPLCVPTVKSPLKLLWRTPQKA